MVGTLDLKFGGLEFKSRPDQVPDAEFFKYQLTPKMKEKVKMGTRRYLSLSNC